MKVKYPQRRNSLRYPGYDYAQPGAIFVTICTSGKQLLFGSVEDGQMVLNPAGAMAVELWQAIPRQFAETGIDAFVVMPDHIHGIVICGTDSHGNAPTTVGEVIRWFKASVVEAYRSGVAHHEWTPYDRHLWQRDYHDRIIRTDAELAAIRAYVEGNPGRWWERHRNES